MDILEIEKAEKAIRSYIQKTPLIRCYELERFCKSSTKIYLKCENLQVTKSFKIRGAMNALLSLSDADKKKESLLGLQAILHKLLHMELIFLVFLQSL